MKLGIITDVHEHIEFLDAALDQFRKECVDHIVVIGDLFETGERIEQTCQRLCDAGVVGVWGNHDYGLCQDVESETREKYSENVLEFMSSLKPRLELTGCHFMHNEPWLNPNDLEDLWYFGGPPTQLENLDRIFNSTQCQWMFAGHYHRWMLMSSARFHSWHGERPICLADDRYFVVVGALFEGNCAIFDTGTGELVPIRLHAT
ncbi:hypothetical protein CKO51_13075 [Rhodopirellula sp. SM50]|nr:metallophosphoesterase family protein [Rhodopirellula sp. SM50]PAY19060.1 hypothetical protein CKO51_13075 [Rhodopirellula sp. SM50]